MIIKKNTCHINLNPSNDDINYCIKQRKQWLKNNKQQKPCVNDWLDQQYNEWSKEKKHNKLLKDIQYNKWFKEHLHIKWINEQMHFLTEHEHMKWFKEQIIIEQLEQKNHKQWLKKQNKISIEINKINYQLAQCLHKKKNKISIEINKINYQLAQCLYKQKKQKEIYELEQQDKLAKSLWTNIL